MDFKLNCVLDSGACAGFWAGGAWFLHKGNFSPYFLKSKICNRKLKTKEIFSENGIIFNFGILSIMFVIQSWALQYNITNMNSKVLIRYLFSSHKQLTIYVLCKYESILALNNLNLLNNFKTKIIFHPKHFVKLIIRS